MFQAPLSVLLLLFHSHPRFLIHSPEAVVSQWGTGRAGPSKQVIKARPGSGGWDSKFTDHCPE